MAVSESFWTSARQVPRQPEAEQVQAEPPDFTDMSAGQYADYRAAHGIRSSDFAGNVEPAQPRYAPAPAPRPIMATDRPLVDPEFVAMQRAASEHSVLAHGYVPRDYNKDGK